MMENLPAPAKTVLKFLLIVVLFLLTNFVASFLAGILMLSGGNISVIGLNQISFDPALTIAYIILYYFLSHFYDLSPKTMYWMFLFTLFLSFTVNFIQGSLVLVILPPVLKRFGLLQANQPKQ